MRARSLHFRAVLVPLSHAEFLSVRIDRAEVVGNTQQQVLGCLVYSIAARRRSLPLEGEPHSEDTDGGTDESGVAERTRLGVPFGHCATDTLPP